MKLLRTKIFGNPIALTAFTLLIFIVAFNSCKKNDDVPPVITLNGGDSVWVVLNTEYVEQGATVIDETDGNITAGLFIDNPVDVNRVGEYYVIYKAIDEAGNEAVPVQRYVNVFNEGLKYFGDYFTYEYQIYPDIDTCIYNSYVWFDSTVNYRILINGFACSSNNSVFADVNGGSLIIPYQVTGDTALEVIVQGNGTINDTLITVEFQRTINSYTSFWKSYFPRY